MTGGGGGEGVGLKPFLTSSQPSPLIVIQFQLHTIVRCTPVGVH